MKKKKRLEDRSRIINKLNKTCLFYIFIKICNLYRCDIQFLNSNYKQNVKIVRAILVCYPITKTTHFRLFYLSIINSVGGVGKANTFKIIHNPHSTCEKRNGSRWIKALAVSLTLYRNTIWECKLKSCGRDGNHHRRRYVISESLNSSNSWHTIDTLRYAITRFVFKQISHTYVQ